MKKLFAFVFAAVLCSVMAAASAKVADMSELGFSADIPLDLENIAYEPIVEQDDGALGLTFRFINADTMSSYLVKKQEAFDSGDPAAIDAAVREYQEALIGNSVIYGQVIGVPTANLDACRQARGIDDKYTLLGVNGDYTYYAVKCALTGDAALSEESRAKFEAGREAVYSMIDSAKLIPIEETELASALGDFNTVDMEGNPVDNSIFGKADLTVLNIWATDCNPCIGEMPELAAWAKTLPENVQVIGLIADVTSASGKTYARAQKIIEKTGVSYTNLLRSDSLYDFVSTVTGTPTTFFLGSDGQPVCDPIVGARLGDCKAAVELFLSR